MTLQNPKLTPLYDFHVAAGANMASFGEYSMPLWYKHGAKAEHLAVIVGAGLFDTSHMASIIVRGSASRALLQRCLSAAIRACWFCRQRLLCMQLRNQRRYLSMASTVPVTVVMLVVLRTQMIAQGDER